jgi:hypothetical protein
MEFRYELLRNWWTHPETGVIIADEDMPPELRPSRTG